MIIRVIQVIMVILEGKDKIWEIMKSVRLDKKGIVSKLGSLTLKQNVGTI